MFKYVHNKKGSALVVVIIVMAVGMVLGTALLRVSLAETRFAQQNENQSQAYYVARAGVEAIAEHMISDGEGNAKDLIGESSEYEFDGGTGIVEVVDTGDRIEVIAEGTYRGVTQKTKAIMREAQEAAGAWPPGSFVVKEKISMGGNGNGQGVEIDGPILVMNTEENSTVDLGQGKILIDDSEVSLENGVIYDPDFVIESATPPVTFDNNTFHSSGINGSTTLNIDASGHTTFSVKHIDLGGNDTITVSGNGSAHMFIHGSIYKNSEKNDYAIYSTGSSKIDVLDGAMLYIYLMTDADVKIVGAGIEGHFYLNAEDSVVEWNNANDKFEGVIIAKEVILHNNIKVGFDENLASGSEDKYSTVGFSFTGYSWED